MKRLSAMVLILAGLCGCLPTHDLAKTLRYADNTPVGVENIKFLDLNQMKRGEACTFNIFYVIPLFGDGSILTAARRGGINNVELIGQTGTWYFPFSTDCTVVYGDKSAIIQRPKEPAK
ncbi:TRL domain-containing protein [Geomonas subterranea]|uniref:TRL-like family protein n=1 Tax=Geomonas subterranea TaxID=2847989 RepID=A0ABX8LEW8_9BACT|nr:MULTISPECIES: TRL domain-containing protein [Geomonas]QXE90212.1 TRL-like family protein [Geomonas subterranea]QXM07662.1 TRL-like family protein [Geomonas subterranea]